MHLLAMHQSHSYIKLQTEDVSCTCMTALMHDISML